jgi:hypothetical protein
MGEHMTATYVTAFVWRSPGKAWGRLAEGVRLPRPPAQQGSLGDFVLITLMGITVK